MRMPRRRTVVRLVLAAVPAAAAGTAISFFQVAPVVDSRRLVIYAAVLASMALVLSVEVLWLLYSYIRWQPHVRRLGQEREVLSKRTRYLEGRLALLQDDVEKLSAISEVARAAAGREDIDEILEDTLAIIQDLIKAEWITIFAWDEKRGALLPRAHKRGRKTWHGKRIPKGLVDETNVHEAFRHRTTIKEVEGDRFQAAVPAVSGGEKLGVVAVSAPLKGGVEEKSQRIEMLESVLGDIAEHIAYALRAVTLRTRAYEDDLTGLGSRGLFDERLDEMVALALRKNQSLSLILADIDHFKRINDGHGHQVGDTALREIAALLVKGLRRYDSAYRYGGEEIAIILPQTRLQDAVRLAERLRSRMERKGFLSGKFHITSSFGVAALGGEILSGGDLVEEADRQLYRAKSEGRNRVEPASLLEANR